MSAKIIVDVVTGYPQGYGFVEMSSDSEARRAVARLNDGNLRGSKIFVDHECGRTLKNWKPRRLGILLNIHKHIHVYIECISLHKLLLLYVNNCHLVYNIYLSISVSGGGFGGKKESGQLRFGGKDRPFRKPIVPNIIKHK